MKVASTIGIMQGRLSSKIGKPLQSFPVNSWRQEFLRASNLGFNQIEWLIDGDNDKENPIRYDGGRKEMFQLALKHGISIKSLCAHKFIDGSLMGNKVDAKLSFSKLLEWTIAAKIEFCLGSN